ncbi:glycosyltransferase family protein [Brevibacterium linens]|uniref:Predicted glycosyl transferase n=1 Tax=Brevibacterium linens ATCC 9172 TaxID=1255617 RepID=A0A2H1IYN3_BRELN|nr:glycosyltransferase [Brevibacterium linens]KAB1942853.1 glycosyl transferase [Brevibacterium linens ATCC 9172]SMX80297.1 Predicted glycosyl transferase [Brevibacterium linens ATCC 9172]
MRRRLRVALFSHDSLGLGHIRRNRALAFALARDLPALTGREVSGLLIASSPEAARFDLPDGWDWVILPGVTPAPGGYVPRALASSMQGLRALRAAAVSAILDQQRPELFIVDRHPFGIGGELAEAIDQVRGHGCRTVLGLREVLDTPSVIDAEWEKVGGPARVADAFDEVWIYGDPDVYDPRSTGEVPATLAARAVTTGYLSQDRPDDGGALPEGVEAARVGSAGTESPGVGSQRFVLTCLGGGSDGGSLASIAVDAQPPDGHRHLIVTGPQMDTEEFDRLRVRAGATTTVIRHHQDIPGLVASAEAVVCMGGYNTLAELMATDTPALVVPRKGHRAEQPRRAFALVAAGAVDAHTIDSLDAEVLSEWFAGRVGRPTDRSHIDLSGLTTVPRLAAELIADARAEAPAFVPEAAPTAGHRPTAPRGTASSARLPITLEETSHAV